MASKSSGRIRKLKSGRYQVRYTDPRTGERVSAGTYRLVEDAEKRDRQIQTMLDNGINPATEAEERQAKEKIQGMTLRQLSDEYRETKKTRNGKFLAESYKVQAIRYVNLTDFADKPLNQITPEEVSKWYSGLSSRVENTADKAYSWVKSVFTQAVKRGYITRNPCDIEGAGKYVSPNEPLIAKPEQVETMYENAKGDLRAIIALAAGGGLRRGEILELRRENVLIVDHKGTERVIIDIKKAVIWTSTGAKTSVPKTPKSVRKVGLSVRDGEILLSHLKSMSAISPDSLLFCSDRQLNTHYARNRLDRMFNNFKAVANYSGTFHSLRAYHATLFGQQNPTPLELMNRLGHTDIRTTLKYLRTTNREFDLLDGTA